MISLFQVVLFSTVLFAIGLYGVLTSRNAVRMLMSIEILLNSANVNFAAYAAYTGLLQGIVAAIIGIAVAAAESSIGIAVILLLDKNFRTVDLDKIKELKG
jgi:NAD(P)H-quinone oxidoreductase subunit 4L